MNTIVSTSSDFVLSGATFKCTGLYNNGQWGMNANWTSGRDSLTAGDIFVALFSGTFDSDGALPTITLNSATAQLNPGQSYSFSCVSTVSWPKPFGITKGLSIQNLGVSFQHTHGQSPANITQVSGTLEVAGASVDMLGYFSGASPVFLLVHKIPSLSLSAVSEHFFGALPENFIDITFQNNQIYYLKTGTSTTGLPSLPTTIESGLNISSEVTLELAGYTFPKVDFTINLTSGIDINATFENAIGFVGFLQLTGANPDYTGGPTLKIKPAASQFELDCGFKFLGENFGQGEMTIAKNAGGKTALAATLSYTGGAIGPFHNPSLSMTYSKADGFQITNWPAVNLTNLIDAAKFANKLSKINKNECGKVVELAFSQINTSFTISPSFVTNKPDVPGVATGQFYIVLNGFYTISTTTDVVICSVDMPEIALSFTAPSDFSFSTIGTAISNAITSNASSIVQQLYENKPALAKFMTVMLGKAGLQQVATKLCEKTKQSLDNYLNKLSVGGGGGAVLGALGGALSALTAIGCSTSSGSHGSHKGPNVTALPRPVITSSSLVGNNWTVNWNSISGANYYHCLLYTSPSPRDRG